jgi:hypothetical protein
VPPIQAPSIFESFNARALSPSQVAQTFVPSRNFDELVQRRHSLVIGPRGSGKTTLLKMLQPAALEGWSHPQADDYSQRIEFSGIFVPFDRSWRAQLDALGGTQIAAREHSLLELAAFGTHVYRGALTAFMSRISTQPALRKHRRVEFTPAQHAELATQLYRSWGLPKGPKSLLGVRSALSERLTAIGEWGKRIASGDTRDWGRFLGDYGWVFANFLDGITAAIDVWEATNNVADERWGLLFDELELAPAEIKRTLFRSLRSIDSRFLFKLALSPFDGEVSMRPGPEDPQPGQDYDPIPLWFSEKRTTLPFCNALWASMLQERNLPPVAPRVVFGHSRFETTDSEWRDDPSRTAYALGSRLQKNFSQLEAIDPSFRDFLMGRGYSSEQLDRLPSNSRAAEIRKIAPLVTARLFFLREQVRPAKKISKRRSRKRLTLYTGWESICAVSEGNPRWFIGLVKPLLQTMTEARMKVAAPQQAVAIESVAARYRAALRTIPVSSELTRRKSTGLVAILDSLGEYFRRKQITDPFTPEPPGSFTVDVDALDDLVEAIGQALNAGALVLVDEDEERRGVEDLRQRKLRLCYLLAAHYGAMPRLGRTVSLRRILKETKFETRDTLQLSLT